MNSMIRVRLGDRSYDVVLAGEQSGGIGPFVRHRCPAPQALVVADEHVMTHAQSVATALHQAGYNPTIATVSPGEASKTLNVAARLYDALANIPADRATPVLAVGGGVIGDLAGFVAATWHRGVPFIPVPTSLLAMVDSAIGGKVAVNHPLGKNLIGAIHQPAGVWIDPTYLSTLPDREFRSGLAEVVKHGVILDADFFEWLETNADLIATRDAAAIATIITACCQQKARVVEQDERETGGGRMVLNYGHTFAHAFETVSGYGAWTHGEAVAAGMVCASRLAERRGMISEHVTAAQIALLERFGLPTGRDPNWPVDAILAAMQRDKKAHAGQLRFVLPTRIGRVELVGGISDSDIRAVLA